MLSFPQEKALIQDKSFYGLWHCFCCPKVRHLYYVMKREYQIFPDIIDNFADKAGIFFQQADVWSRKNRLIECPTEAEYFHPCYARKEKVLRRRVHILWSRIWCGCVSQALEAGYALA